MLIKLPQWKILVLGFAAGCSHSISQAADSTSIEFGSGNKTKMVRLGMQWNWDRQWWRSNGTHLGGYWDLNFAHWRGEQYRDIPNTRQSINVIGITPVLRLQNNHLKGLYGEIGIGIRLLSEHYDNNGRQLSTKFQFSDHIGIGYVFANNLELGVKLQHFSNASIKKPNDGLNFISIGLRYPI